MGEAAPGKLEVSSRIPQGRIHSSRDMQVQGQGEGGGSLAEPEKVSEQFSGPRENNVLRKKHLFLEKRSKLVNYKE